MNIIDVTDKNIAVDKLVMQLGAQSQHVDHVSALTKKEQIELASKADKLMRQDLVKENIQAAKVPWWKKVFSPLLSVVSKIFLLIPLPVVNVVGTAVSNVLKSSVDGAHNIKLAKIKSSIDQKMATIDFMTESNMKSMEAFTDASDSSANKQKIVGQTISNYNNSLIKG